MNSTSNIPASRRPVRVMPVLLAGCALFAAAPALADGPPLRDANIVNNYAYQSAVFEAKADYYLGLANAHNLPTASARAAARAEAQSNLREALELAKDRLRERRELSAELRENRYNPVINPARFLSVAEIVASPNPYLPLVPGRTRHYRAETDEGVETIAVTVTDQTREILGVTCVVVRDIVKLNDHVVEDTLDWLAQDRAGNVWYFGERVADYDEDGLIASLDGSFQAGEEYAQAGILMPAVPLAGQFYRQEFFLGEAEDAFEILSLTESVTVPAGSFTGCLKTEDFTPLEPDAEEFKYYARGMGRVLEINGQTGKRTELIEVTEE